MRAVVPRGKAAFLSLGDWTLAELVRLGLKAGQDFGWACYPGTDHVFVVIADGFTLVQAANRSGLGK